MDVAAEELPGNSFQHWINVTTEASEPLSQNGEEHGTCNVIGPVGNTKYCLFRSTMHFYKPCTQSTQETDVLNVFISHKYIEV